MNVALFEELLNTTFELVLANVISLVDSRLVTINLSPGSVIVLSLISFAGIFKISPPPFVF